MMAPVRGQRTCRPDKENTDGSTRAALLLQDLRRDCSHVTSSAPDSSAALSTAGYDQDGTCIVPEQNQEQCKHALHVRGTPTWACYFFHSQGMR